MTAIIIVTQEALQGFTHPGLDLQTGELIELEAEPAPVQMELFAKLEQLDLFIEARHAYALRRLSKAVDRYPRWRSSGKVGDCLGTSG